MTEVERILAAIEATGFVARDTSDGAIVSRASVSTRYGTSVTVTAWDGIARGYEATACRTLAQQFAGFREASPEEVAEFERLERPAPQNWD